MFMGIHGYSHISAKIRGDPMLSLVKFRMPSTTKASPNRWLAAIDIAILDA